MEWTDGEYRISENKKDLLLTRIGEFLANSYWANNRTMETIKFELFTRN